VTRYDYERAVKLPEDFVQEFALAKSKAFESWMKAREAADFSLFRDDLTRIVELNRKKADYLGYEGSPYDALLDAYERGMTAEELRDLFGRLGPAQSAIVEEITASPNQPDCGFLKQEWPEEGQWQMSVRVLSDMGYDFDAGRQDKSPHPFSTSFGLKDVRVTTRFSSEELFAGLMGSIHEGGHALYGQGHDPADARTPLAEGASLGIHESQSRMWENIIGRSRPFWRRYLPAMREAFPGRLDDVSAEQLYRAATRVQPSFIRVEADECTYNLHIIIRFEIEVELVEGRLGVSDVPEAWNSRVKQYLGLDVPNDALGCLQDIHWSHGSMGYFPTYALGNLYAAQLFEALERDLPEVWDRVGEGSFASIVDWLREKVHRHGRRKLPREIIHDATGSAPDSQPYIRYLESKYGEAYGIR
jgi:carboxypeptidase Taq